MGFMLSSDEIEVYLKEQELLTNEVRETCVYGHVLPQAQKYLSWGTYSADLKEAYFLIGVDKNNIILIPVNRRTGKLNNSTEPVTISLEDLTAIKIKKGRLMDRVILTGKEEELKIKISKVIVGMAWHDGNIQNFMTKIEELALSLTNKHSI